MSRDDKDTARSNAEELFLSNLQAIDAIVASISRRHRLPTDEAEELRSEVRLKLIDDDYAVFRKFRGNSSLRTYLAAVIQHLFLDRRDRAWGRFRPSLVARRSGPAAVLLEQFIVRDRRTFDEAWALVESRGIALDPDVGRQLCEHIELRRRPRTVHTALDEHVEAPDTSEDALLEQERTTLAGHTAGALRRAIGHLGPRQRLIVQLRFEQGLRVVDIARVLSGDQKALYRELERLTSELRAALESEGVEGAEVTELLGDPRLDFGDALRGDAENRLDVRLKVSRAEQQGERL